jgi:hypothetical protein
MHDYEATLQYLHNVRAKVVTVYHTSSSLTHLQKNKRYQVTLCIQVKVGRKFSDNDTLPTFYTEQDAYR